MSPNELFPRYYGRPIAKLSSLAKALDVDEADLIEISSNTRKYWRKGRALQKKDGTPRLTHNSVDPLKSIQRRIKRVFLEKVAYPGYLLGGISSDEVNRRGYLENAAIHSNKKILFSEDVKNFFPSTTSTLVHSIWIGVFNFHPVIANILTQLTTYDECLPQGWVTSSHLANLALWNHEAQTVSFFRSKGYCYSRFVDDVVVSSNHYITKDEKTFIVSELIHLFSRCGYKAKRSKHTIATSAGSTINQKKMRVGNLNVDNGRPTMPKSRRNNIRAAVFLCEKTLPCARNTEEYRRQWKKASGLVASMKKLHPNESLKLRSRLNKCEVCAKVF